ncbi:MAG: hemopexin repeat-containing protein [Bacteroidia bacterium]
MMKTFYTVCTKAVLALATLVLISASTTYAQGCLDAAFFVNDADNKAHFFRGDETRDRIWDGASTATVDMNSRWTGLTGWTGIDAAYILPGRIVAYRGSETVVINSNTKAAYTAPVPITTFINFFPPHFQEGIDAVFAWPQVASGDTLRIFFFKGTELIRVDYDLATNRYFNAQPPTNAGFGGVFTNHFTEGVDAALYHPGSRKLYFFRGDQYIRYNAATGVIDPGYPLRTSSPANWGSIFTDWSCIDPVNNNNCGVDYQIPDNSCSDANEIEINVTSAVGSALGTDIEVDGMVLYIEHPHLSDLAISLISPSGKEVVLVDGVGGSGDNFGASCVGAQFTRISRSATLDFSSGAAPYIGIYKPQGDLDDFNDGTDPNGIWKLRMCDNANDDIGTLKGFRIDFNAVNTALEDVLETGLGLSVAPNPSQGNIQISLAQTSPHAIELQVVDAMGKTVFQYSEPQAGTRFDQQIDLSHLSNGIYYVRSRRGAQVATERVLIQK